MIESFLLDPNFAYLFLVFGLALALMAILTPGTGIFEIGAIFTLLFAGWGVYNLEKNYWAVIVLAAGIVPFILATRKSGKLYYLLIAIAAMVIGSAYLFKGDAWWKPAVNPFLALTASIIVGGFFWIAASKTMEIINTEPSHSLDELIGAEGHAKTSIHKDGTVQVMGELWTAYSDNPIENGTLIRVLDREGFLLKVEQEGFDKTE